MDDASKRYYGKKDYDFKSKPEHKHICGYWCWTSWWNRWDNFENAETRLYSHSEIKSQSCRTDTHILHSLHNRLRRQIKNFHFLHFMKKYYFTVFDKQHTRLPGGQTNKGLFYFFTSKFFNWMVFFAVFFPLISFIKAPGIEIPPGLHGWIRIVVVSALISVAFSSINVVWIEYRFRNSGDNLL